MSLQTSPPLACLLVQGPFSASQLQKLLRAGVVEEATVVRHPQEGEMPLAEVSGCLAMR